jgi:hypothetical protein
LRRGGIGLRCRSRADGLCLFTRTYRRRLSLARAGCAGRSRRIHCRRSCTRRNRRPRIGSARLPLPDPFDALGRTTFARFVVENGALPIQDMHALAPLGYHAIDARRDGKLGCAGRLRGLALTLDLRTFARDALAFSRAGFGIGRQRHERRSQPQRQEGLR